MDIIEAFCARRFALSAASGEVERPFASAMIHPGDPKPKRSARLLLEKFTDQRDV